MRWYWTYLVFLGEHDQSVALSASIMRLPYLYQTIEIVPAEIEDRGLPWLGEKCGGRAHLRKLDHNHPSSRAGCM